MVKLGKPAIRLASRQLNSWWYNSAHLPPTGNNASNFRYDNLGWIKDSFIKNNPSFLDVAPENNFSFTQQLMSWNDNPVMMWSMYILKNKTNEDKKVDAYFQLSSRTSGIWGAYVVANGSLLVSYTSNSASPSWNFTDNNGLTVPANSGLVVLVQNGAYFHGQVGSTQTYFFRMVHNVKFNLPEGVEWDYDAYKQLLT